MTCNICTEKIISTQSISRGGSKWLAVWFVTFAPTQASAACYETDVLSTVKAPPTIELCVNGVCEDAVLKTQCGNIDYATESYQADDTKWLFRIRFQESGSEDDVSTVVLNSKEIPARLVRTVMCRASLDFGSCRFVNKVVNQVQQ